MEKINKLITELLNDANVSETHENITEYKKNAFDLINKIDTLIMDFEYDNDIDLTNNYDNYHTIIQLLKLFKGAF